MKMNKQAQKPSTTLAVSVFVTSRVVYSPNALRSQNTPKAGRMAPNSPVDLDMARGWGKLHMMIKKHLS
jgi:hypothetical protein